MDTPKKLIFQEVTFQTPPPSPPKKKKILKKLLMFYHEDVPLPTFLAYLEPV